MKENQFMDRGYLYVIEEGFTNNIYWQMLALFLCRKITETTVMSIPTL